MKNIYLALSLFGVLTLSSCNKDEGDPDTTTTEKTGTLKLVVSYYQGSKAPNADVQLFTSQADYNAQTNAVRTDQTDNSGEVYFTDLPTVQYWWYVKGVNGSDNLSSTHWSGAALAADKTTEKLVQLR